MLIVGAARTGGESPDAGEPLVSCLGPPGLMQDGCFSKARGERPDF